MIYYGYKYHSALIPIFDNIPTILFISYLPYASYKLVLVRLHARSLPILWRLM